MTITSLIYDTTAGLERLTEIMRRLRDPEGGCPWDIQQSFESIAPYTLEEAHEVAEAIRTGNRNELADELGDLLLQVVYHAQMAAEEGSFDIDDVISRICEKMIRRHPHVFGDADHTKTAAQQSIDWEHIKAQERAGKDTDTIERTLDGIALALPALTRAVKLQNRAARVGFDWPEISQVLEKLQEEAGELVEARDGDPAHLAEEFGDMMFVMANLARHLKIDPEAATRAANAKFERRFRAIEDALAQDGRSPSTSDLEEMDALWEAAKRAERAQT